MPDVRPSSQPKRLLNAVVVSSGLMQKTVKVRIGKKVFNKLVSKAFKRDEEVLVHDPASSLRTGDIIEIEPSWRVSKRVRHVVTRILAPFGPSIHERPAVPSAAERIRTYKLAKLMQGARRRARRQGLVDAEGKPRLQLPDGTPLEVGADGKPVGLLDGKPVGLLRLLQERGVDWAVAGTEKVAGTEELKLLGAGKGAGASAGVS